MKKSEKTQITKEKIINAAMIGFGENGYGNASLNRIYKDNFNLYMQKKICVLCDNAWGTNFPLWYKDNARFDFSISKEK